MVKRRKKRQWIYDQDLKATHFLSTNSSFLNLVDIVRNHDAKWNESFVNIEFFLIGVDWTMLQAWTYQVWQIVRMQKKEKTNLWTQKKLIGVNQLMLHYLLTIDKGCGT